MNKLLASIELVAFDVDGVLTDGRIFFDEEGREMHAFHAHDGMGMVHAGQQGLKLAAISGRPAPGVYARLKQLRLCEIHLGVVDKVGKLREVAARLGVELDKVCFVGDDINDVDAMRIAAVSFAPANAHADALAQASYVTVKKGGEGALREVLDRIAAAKKAIITAG